MAQTKKTATDVLIAAMEEFGKAEPDAVVVIWTDGNDLVRLSNANLSIQVGLCESAKALILHRINEGD